MTPLVHGFDWPDRFVVGAVGRPGERTFYLQARAGSHLVSVALEKEQSAALAIKIDEVLDRLMAEDGNPFSVPEKAPEGILDDEPLDEPIEERFRVGTMSLGWDPSTAQIVIEALPLVGTDDEEALEEFDPEEFEPEEVLQVRIPVGSARVFAHRAREVVSAGRPICPLCGAPIEGDAHVCSLPDGFA
ncbi:DUF3090 domain-containing protein [Occultella glacieicola]|uniref:DUF3090 domain-containing protein n=1 Tax=Occultella glacieicola TaxID=2518684 RepID=A0ABY2E479_9MICO|nr:DUF3090 domain-containing protein [Occultella glacieicola]TDE94833.1 DUF3090 domain-containing protein [Occultella glacieicola]